MGRGKIECETKREKNDFCLGGMQEEGESKVLPSSRRHKESMCKSKERGRCTRKKKKREQPRGSRLEKKKTTKRGLCVEKKIKKREQSVAAFERDNWCVCENKEKEERFFFSRETYTRIIVIDLIIVKLFEICSRGFFL